MSIFEQMQEIAASEENKEEIKTETANSVINLQTLVEQAEQTNERWEKKKADRRRKHKLHFYLSLVLFVCLLLSIISKLFHLATR